MKNSFKITKKIKHELLNELAGGDYCFIQVLEKYNYKHKDLDRLIYLNDKHGWDSSFTTEALEEYIKIKFSIFKDLGIAEEDLEEYL